MVANTRLSLNEGVIEIAGELAAYGADDARSSDERLWLNVTVTLLDGDRRHSMGAMLFPIGPTGCKPTDNTLASSVMPARSISCRVNGRRTTLKLEAVFVDSLQEIADAQGTSLDELLSQIEREHLSQSVGEHAGGTRAFNLTSAARVFVACHQRAHRRPLLRLTGSAPRTGRP